MAEAAYRKALELLARRPHFEREIAQKLQVRGFDEAECQRAVSALRAASYLDDLQCARDFIRAKLRRAPLGRRRLRAELLRRGAGAAAVESALAETEFDAEIDRVRQAVERWRQRGGRNRESLLRHLDRRGFSKGDILKVVDDFPEVDSS